MGAFINSPLPPVPAPSPCAARPLRSADVTPLHRYYEPSRHRLAFSRLPGGCRLYGRSCSIDFAMGRGRFLQLLGLPLSSCRLYHPAGVMCLRDQFATSSFCLRPHGKSSASGTRILTRLPLSSLSLRPDHSLTILSDGFVNQLHPLRFLHECDSSYEGLAGVDCFVKPCSIRSTLTACPY